MAISILSTQIQPPKLATRAQYQAALCQLTFAWPMLVHRAKARGIKLRETHHLVLSLFLQLQPDRECKQGGQRVSNDGRYQSKTRGIAEWLAISRQRVNACISELQRADLLWALQLEKGDRLQSGSDAATNILRYRVNVETIQAAFEAMPRGYFTARRVSIDGRENGPSDGPDSGPSLRSPRNDLPPTPKPPSGDRASRRRDRAHAPPAHQAAGETPPSAPGACGESAPENTPAPETAPRDGEHAACRVVDALAAAWDAARIPEKGGTTSRVRKSERTLLGKRLAELGRETLEAAIVGATTKPREFWTRDIWAACAYVFHSADKIHEFAQLGRVELARRAAGDDVSSRRWRRPANDSGGQDPC